SDSTGFRQQHNIPADAPLVGMVARVAPEKDFETLFAAFATVVTEYPAARLVIVGAYESPATSHAYWQQLCARVRAFRLDTHVIWTGYRADSLALMRAMDV